MVWTVWTIGGLTLAAVLVAGGLFLLWGRRDDPDDPALLTEPSRLVIGLSLVVVGYHFASYSLPQGWLALRVPPDRLWMLAAGVAIAILLTVFSDKIDRGVGFESGDGDGGGDGGD